MRTRIELIVGLLFCSALTAVAQDGPLFQTLDQYTRLQIPVTSGTSFRLLNANPLETKLIVERVRNEQLSATGAWKDHRVASVVVHPVGLDKAELTIRFKEAGTEAFAYLQGNNLVLDLWRQEGKAAAKPAEKPVKASTAKLEKPKPVVAKKIERKIASIAAAPPAEAVAPLRSGVDIFQRFSLPMPELEVAAKDGGFDLPPKLELETKWKFENGDKATGDGRAFEFAKKLFSQKKYGLTIKTIEIALRDFPETDHKDEMKLLQAFSYRLLAKVTQTDSLNDRAEAMITELSAIRDEEGAPLPFNRVLEFYFGQKEYNKKNWLEAIQHFEFVNASTPKESPEFPYVQALLADCYTKVNQSRRAERLFRYLAEHYPKHILGREGAYRIADLLGLEKNYKRVIEEGEAAIHAHPEYEKARSEVLFQIGEASFWLGQYARSEKYFRRFIELSSAQTVAGLAWVRLGEIAELARGDLKSAHASYLQAKNGYPFSQADIVATVRLARIDLPTEKEPGYVVKTLRELLTSKDLDRDLMNMAKLTLGQYMLATGEFDQAIQMAKDGMSQSEGTAYEGYKISYMKSLVAKMDNLNKTKKFAEALALYNRERKWFDIYGAESYRAAADTFRGLSLFGTANQLMERYRSEKAKSRGLASVGPDASLQLAKAKEAFARNAYAETLLLLNGRKDSESLTLGAISEFHLGRKKEAYSLADKAIVQAAAEQFALGDAKVEQLAEILIDRDMNDRDFARLGQDLSKTASLLEKESEAIAFNQADALWYQKRQPEAQAAYKALIEKYPESSRVPRARYNLGMSLVSVGKRDEAVKQLTLVRDSGQSVWAESAKQELQLIEWESKYSSVLRTLPPSGLGIVN